MNWIEIICIVGIVWAMVLINHILNQMSEMKHQIAVLENKQEKYSSHLSSRLTKQEADIYQIQQKINPIYSADEETDYLSDEKS